MPEFIEELHSADEPYGHHDYYSKIERAWQRAPRGRSFMRRRVDRFDSYSSLMYSPVEYEHRTFLADLSADQPSPSWTENSFTAFVRGEFGDGKAVRKRPEKFQPEIKDVRSAGFEVLERFLERTEEELVYSSVISTIRDRFEGRMAESVFEVLCHPLIGNSKNRTNIDFDQFSRLVQTQIDRRDRLFIILPSFPFKDQNRFRTLSKASTVDLGEIALLVRLHILALALYQVHPFGADVVVLSDGLLYSDVFGVDRGQALKYREQLRGFRNLLNIQGTVSILDLSDIIGNLRNPDTGESTFDRTLRHLRHEISGFKDRKNEPVGRAYAALKRGMKWNLNTRESLQSCSDSDAWLVLTEPDRLRVPVGLRADWEAIDQRSEEAAERYAATNLCLSYHSVLERTFPGAIRATVHPKKGQFAMPSCGTVFPWNGVGWASDRELRSVSVETQPWFELGEVGVVDMFRFDLTGEPLFFAKPDHG